MPTGIDIPAFFVSIYSFYSIAFYCNLWYDINKKDFFMRVTTSKSKNAESFYISKGYVNDKGVSTSVIVRKLGTLNES